ncbi:MAG TPA: clostripain-related cysteine peptidase, partial [Roseiflexaceae bacterium]|nr:clostripain-related cysteine peptidase [Roseiflexaceae bacterium]
MIVLGLLALALSSLEEDTSSALAPTREPPIPTRRVTKPTVAPTRIASASATPTAPDATSAAENRAEWTVLVYLDGDNDLEEVAIGDFAEMASVGSTAAVNIVVQFDRIATSEDWDATAHGNWSSVKRFRIERGKRPIKSNQLADLGELNMGDPRTLVDFATWGIQTYPARHYALIFWDHGAAWPGVASDDTSDGDMLTLPDLAGALAELRQRTGVQKLDLIGFDACLMGQIDVLQAIAPFGDVAIGSADLEPGEGWAWNAWLSDLTRKPPQNAAALAPSIIKSFTAFYKKEDDPSVTLAAFDLTKIEQMTGQIDALASAMIETMPKSYAAIGKARSYAAEYASGDTDISAIDLGYFADSLVTAGADKRVSTAARALSRTIKAARIAAGFGADHPKSSGISVYFPRKKKHYDTSYGESSPLTTATRWDEFLQQFYQAGRSNSTRSAISPPTLKQLSVAPDTPLTLAATISGSETAYVYYFVGAVDHSEPDLVQVLAMDYIYPPGATLGDAIPAWHSGEDVQLTWKSTSWYISNGTDVVIAPFNPVDYGANTYSVEGTYTRRSGTRIPVSIEFTVTQGRGTLQHIWAFDTGGSANPRPRELKPRAGDTFTPTIASFSAQNHDDQRIRDGKAITFGAAPLVAFEAMVPSGTYTLGLMVEDIAG